jgi:hypothetical protein
MYDLHNPSPFVLTHFERIATIASLFAVALSIALDLLRGRSSRSGQS